eukprot:TRINITY_DN4860_c0_g1_i1.p1 TRINITY_DN4860_c0_g1~~TRINITY_DN4860_c0_g1_i1.p1  ORF type:complete len:1211 (+),score=201.12 TRINITY_DN4860_c0_g1_i1:54-3686(+)
MGATDAIGRQDDAEVRLQKERIDRAVLSAKENRRSGFDEMLDKVAGEAKTYPLPVPSKLEQQYMAKARERQAANIIQKQIVWRKEFQGEAFLPSPAVIRFDDFEVGKVYSQKFRLTNISYTFNSFKLLPLPDSVRDFFELSYTLMGAMSAGMSCTITVNFTPKINADIATEIPVLAKTGPLGIPLVCTTKKVAIELSPRNRRITFGQVALAESSTMIFTVANRGALDTTFDIVGDAVALLTESDPDQGQDAQQRGLLTIKPALLEDIHLPARGEVKIALTFHPAAVCTLDSFLCLRFADRQTPDVTVFLVGQGIDVPVFVDKRSVLDFHCCYIGCLYRDVLELRNRGKTSMRCRPVAPPEIRNCIDFVPKVGFIQPESLLQFQIKFRPTKELLRALGPFRDAGSEEFSVPIRVEVADQTMPVTFTLRVTLTTSSLLFEPTSLDFGACSTDEGVRLPLRVTNQSLLEQRVGFIALPPEVSVSPDFGFATMLPKETLVMDICFRPTQATEYKLNLRLKTDCNDDYVLPIHGVGKQAPLYFTEPVVKLPVTAIGDRSMVGLLVRNRTKTHQVFEFEVPQRSGIQLFPLCADVAPGGSEPITITFTPTPDIFAPPPPKQPPVIQEEPQGELARSQSLAPPSRSGTLRKPKKGANKKEEEEREAKEKEEQEKLRLERERDAALAAAKEEEEDYAYRMWSESQEGEPWSRHRTLAIPCYVRGWDHRAVMLEVSTTVNLPHMLAELAEEPVQQQPLPAETPKPGPKGAKPKPKPKASKEKPAEESLEDRPEVKSPVPPPIDYSDPATYLNPTTPLLNQISFGDIPTAKSVTKTITLKFLDRTGPAEFGFGAIARLTVKPLDPFGPFTVVKPPENLRPGQICELTVRFTPSSHAVFSEQLEISSSCTNSIRLLLTGRGLAPSLEMTQTPPHPNDDETTLYINAGHCLSNDTVRKVITMANPCAFDLPFEISFVRPTVQPWNWNGSLPFLVVPNSGTIPKGQTLSIEALFLPDHEFEFYRASATVTYGGEKNRKNLEFAGSAWLKTMYFSCPTGRTAAATVDLIDPHQPRHPQDFSTEDLLFNATQEDDHFLTLEANPAPRFILEFNSSTPSEVVTHTVIIGNNRSSDPKKGAIGGEYTFEGLTDLDAKYGWRIDLPKSNVEAGGKRIVNLSFAPTALAMGSMPVPGVTVLTQAEAKCILKAGSETTTVTLCLKGSVKA